MIERMVFRVGTDGKLRTEPEIESPDIYRMTPYEFAVTAEPRQQVVTCVQPIPVRSSTVQTPVRSRIPLSFDESGERGA